MAIASGMPYSEVYQKLRDLTKAWLAKPVRGRRQRWSRERVARHGGSPRNGVPRERLRQYLPCLGWTWTPTMQVGAGSRCIFDPTSCRAGKLVGVALEAPRRRDRRRSPRHARVQPGRHALRLRLLAGTTRLVAARTEGPRWATPGPLLLASAVVEDNRMRKRVEIAITVQRPCAFHRCRRPGPGLSCDAPVLL